MSRTDQTEAKIATLSATPASQTATRPARVGVLLLNLGTPDGTEFKPMWRYLREFLSDPRIVELNRLIWYPILYGLVLTVRPKKSGENYARIWNRERNESPLHTFTRSQSSPMSASTGACATATPRRVPWPASSWSAAATAFSHSRSIRNIRRPPPPPPTTSFFAP
jgi:hypothetical protein